VQNLGMPMPLAREPLGTRIVSYLDGKDFQEVIECEIPNQLDIEGNPNDYNNQMCILDELLHCIESKEKQQPTVNFAEGYKSFLVSRAAIESSKTGQTV
jgi:hypothetical protein